MKFTKNDEVFEDSLSGVYYTKEHTIVPVAMVDADKVTKFGVLLKPYYAFGGLPGEDPFDAEQLAAGVAKLGYDAHDSVQALLVTEEQFATRFKRVGVLSQEVDLGASLREYQLDGLDFSNRDGIIAAATKELQKETGGLAACIFLTLLNDYIANTPATNS